MNFNNRHIIILIIPLKEEKILSNKVTYEGTLVKMVKIFCEQCLLSQTLKKVKWSLANSIDTKTKLNLFITYSLWLIGQEIY